MIAAFVLLGIVIVLFFASLHLYIEYRIKQYRKSKKVNLDIALNPWHPAINEYKKLMIDEMGMDELVVEQELDRIKTIPKLREVIKIIKKELSLYDKRKK